MESTLNVQIYHKQVIAWDRTTKYPLRCFLEESEYLN